MRNLCSDTANKKNICIKKQTNKQKQMKQTKKEQKQSNVFLIFKDRVIVSLFLIISINVLKYSTSTAADFLLPQSVEC